MHCCDLCQGPLCVIGREGPVDLLMCCGCFMTFRQAAAATPLPPHDPAPRTEAWPYDYLDHVAPPPDDLPEPVQLLLTQDERGPGEAVDVWFLNEEANTTPKAG